MSTLLMGLLRRLMELIPQVEVLIRMIYWRNPSIRFPKSKGLTSAKKSQVISGAYQQLLSELRRAGIGEGDLVLLHSSMDGLLPLGVEPERIIDDMIALIGENGTIVVPAFPPYYAGKDRFFILNAEENGTDDILTYRVDRKVCWTGMLPTVFLGYPGVVRSEFPYNPLAAIGPLSKEMMRKNLDSGYPHGRHSAWEFCIEHGVKILFLGVKAGHSFTLIHAVEDLMGARWPIKYWYVKKTYRIVGKDGQERYLDAYSRRTFWARYMDIEHTDRELIKKGYIKDLDVHQVVVQLVDNTHGLVQYAISQAEKGRPCYYMIPRRYYKGRAE